MKTFDQAVGNIAGVRKAIDEGPFDAVIAVSPENVRYIADVEIATQKSIRDRLALILWAKGHEPVFIVCQVEEGFVRQETWITDIRGFKEFVTSPIDLLAEVLAEKGLTHARIGCELEYLAGKYVRQLETLMPRVVLEPCDQMFRRARMIKTQREKDILRFGFRGTEKAMLATYATVKEGEDEWSLVRRLADHIILSGSDLVAFNHINAGPNTGFPHAGPSNYRVQKGDIVKADSGGYYQSYISNVGRTAKLGKPTQEESDTWKRLREIHHNTIDLLRPGNTGRQVFEAAAIMHEKARLPFPFAHNGHSIGLEVHEAPFIGPYEDTVYEAGMISTVETRVRWVGQKGLHMEDLFEITENGPRLLSDAFDNEEIFVI
ncbi:aminopeptidase P family protein [Microvirga sp. BT689]|uniref:M24 family metallopeptidase n=1 Tax=Microvirga arvi TaxID=2778731 RepID=UPI00195163D8|nr:Xaa-Pro peptidase family protein [Microvirga arvi]MBM6581186.1 aminopeptidase P family protein [Microvirga arvi]